MLIEYSYVFLTIVKKIIHNLVFVTGANCFCVRCELNIYIQDEHKRFSCRRSKPSALVRIM